MFLKTFEHNPITKAERKYQRRWTPRLPTPLRVIFTLVYLLSLQLAFNFWTSLPSGIGGFTVRGASLSSVYVFVVLTILLHIAAHLWAIHAGAEAVSREKRAGTWELLLLSGHDSAEILRAKWAGAMTRITSPWLLLFPLEVGLICLRSTTLFLVGFASTDGQMIGDVVIRPATRLHWIVLPLLVFLFLMASLSLAGGIGVLAGTLWRERMAAFVGGVLLLMLLVVVGVLLTSVVMELTGSVTLLGDSTITFPQALLPALRWTMLDQGITVEASVMALHFYESEVGIVAEILNWLREAAVVLLNLLLFPVGLRGALWLASLVIEHRWALPMRKRST